MSDETHLHAYLRASDDESAVGDWSDVLNRSRRQRRRAATRAILWAAVALAALVIAVPAFGLGGIFPGILSGSAAPPQKRHRTTRALPAVSDRSCDQARRVRRPKPVRCTHRGRRLLL